MKHLGYFNKTISGILLFAFAVSSMLDYRLASAYANTKGGRDEGVGVSDQTSSKLELPQALGSIEKIYSPEKGSLPPTPNSLSPRIYYIQDAHTSLEAQENIAKIVEYLAREKGVKRVLVEGYEGPMPLDPLFPIQDSWKKERTAHFFLDHLRLGGAEYAYVTRKKDFEIVGIENDKDYLEGLKAYQNADSNRTIAAQDLALIQKYVSTLSSKIYPQDFQNYLKLKERFETKKLSLADYVFRLMKLGDRGQVIGDSKTPSPNTYPPTPHLDIVTQYLAKQSLTPEEEKELNEKLKTLDSKTFFGELKALEQEIVRTYLINPIAKQVYEYQRQLELLNKLNQLTLTPEEYKELSNSYLVTSSSKDKLPVTSYQLQTQDIAQFLANNLHKFIVLKKEWESLITDAFKFYELVQKRDLNFQTNILQTLKDSNQYLVASNQKNQKQATSYQLPATTPTILVTGGFHQKGITDFLEQKQISYAVISPRITKEDPLHEKRYNFLMSGNLYPFEKPFLNPVTVTKGLPATQAGDSHLSMVRSTHKQLGLANAAKSLGINNVREQVLSAAASLGKDGTIDPKSIMAVLRAKEVMKTVEGVQVHGAKNKAQANSLGEERPIYPVPPDRDVKTAIQVAAREGYGIIAVSTDEQDREARMLISRLKLEKPIEVMSIDPLAFTVYRWNDLESIKIGLTHSNSGLRLVAYHRLFDFRKKDPKKVLQLFLEVLNQEKDPKVIPTLNHLIYRLSDPAVINGWRETIRDYESRRDGNRPTLIRLRMQIGDDPNLSRNSGFMQLYDHYEAENVELEAVQQAIQALDLARAKQLLEPSEFGKRIEQRARNSYAYRKRKEGLPFHRVAFYSPVAYGSQDLSMRNIEMEDSDYPDIFIDGDLIVQNGEWVGALSPALQSILLQYLNENNLVEIKRRINWSVLYLDGFNEHSYRPDQISWEDYSRKAKLPSPRPAAFLEYVRQNGDVDILNYDVEDPFRLMGIATALFERLVATNSGVKKIRFSNFQRKQDIGFVDSLVKKKRIYRYHDDIGVYYTLEAPKIDAVEIAKFTHDLALTLNPALSYEERVKRAAQNFELLAEKMGLSDRFSFYLAELDEHGKLMKVKGPSGTKEQVWRSVVRHGLAGSSRLSGKAGPFTGEKKAFETMLQNGGSRGGAGSLKDDLWIIESRRKLPVPIREDKILAEDLERYGPSSDKITYGALRSFDSSEVLGIFWIMGDVSEEDMPILNMARVLISHVLARSVQLEEISARFINSKLEMKQIERNNARLQALMAKVHDTKNRLHHLFSMGFEGKEAKEASESARITNDELKEQSKQISVRLGNLTRLSTELSDMQRRIGRLPAETKQTLVDAGARIEKNPEFDFYVKAIQAKNLSELDALSAETSGVVPFDHDKILQTIRDLLEEIQGFQVGLNQAQQDFENLRESLRKNEKRVRDLIPTIEGFLDIYTDEWLEKNIEDLLTKISNLKGKPEKQKRSRNFYLKWIKTEISNLREAQWELRRLLQTVETTNQIQAFDVITEVKKVFDLEALQGRTEPAVSYEWQSPIEHAEIISDPSVIKTDAVRCLLDNALKIVRSYRSSHPGPRQIKVMVEPQRSYLKIKIKDTGSGFDWSAQAVRDRIFTLGGGKITEGSEQDGSSSGLGLYLAQLGLRALGGDLYLEETKLGEGSAFAILLPSDPRKGMSSTVSNVSFDLLINRINYFLDLPEVKASPEVALNIQLIRDQLQKARDNKALNPIFFEDATKRIQALIPKKKTAQGSSLGEEQKGLAEKPYRDDPTPDELKAKQFAMALHALIYGGKTRTNEDFEGLVIARLKLNQAIRLGLEEEKKKEAGVLAEILERIRRHYLGIKITDRLKRRLQSFFEKLDQDEPDRLMPYRIYLAGGSIFETENQTLEVLKAEAEFLKKEINRFNTRFKNASQVSGDRSLHELNAEIRALLTLYNKIQLKRTLLFLENKPPESWNTRVAERLILSVRNHTKRHELEVIRENIRNRKEMFVRTFEVNLAAYEKIDPKLLEEAGIEPILKTLSLSGWDIRRTPDGKYIVPQKYWVKNAEGRWEKRTIHSVFPDIPSAIRSQIHTIESGLEEVENILDHTADLEEILHNIRGYRYRGVSLKEIKRSLELMQGAKEWLKSGAVDLKTSSYGPALTAFEALQTALTTPRKEEALRIQQFSRVEESLKLIIDNMESKRIREIERIKERVAKRLAGLMRVSQAMGKASAKSLGIEKIPEGTDTLEAIDEARFSFHLAEYFDKTPANAGKENPFRKEGFRYIEKAVSLEIKKRGNFQPPDPFLHQQIDISAPVRLDLASGLGSDLFAVSMIEGGRVLNAAITLNGKKPVRLIVKRIPEPEIRIHSIDQGLSETIDDLRAFQSLRTSHGDPWKLFKGALIEAGIVPESLNGDLKEILRSLGGGLEISTDIKGVPARSGLGVNGILGAALLKALYEITGRTISEQDLILHVVSLQLKINTLGGWQDPIGGGFGGIKWIEAKPNDPIVSFKQLKLSEAVREELRSRMFLVYSGSSFSEGDPLERIIASHPFENLNHVDDQNQAKTARDTMHEALLRGDIDEFGAQMRYCWKAALNVQGSLVTNTFIDRIMQKADPLIEGGKVSGAGSGFVLLLAKKGKEEELQELIQHEVQGTQAKLYDWDFDDEGIAIQRKDLDKQTFDLNGKAQVKGTILDYRGAFTDGDPIEANGLETPIDQAEALKLRLNDPEMKKVWQKLELAEKMGREHGRVLSITVPLRGAVFFGFQDALPYINRFTDQDTKRLRDLPSLITIQSGNRLTATISLARKPDGTIDENNIHYVNETWNYERITPVPLKLTPKMETPEGQPDAVAYILGNIFGLRGIKVAIKVDHPAMLIGGGFESSNAYNLAVGIVAQVLTAWAGRTVTSDEVFALMRRAAPNEFQDRTGFQGGLAAWQKAPVTRHYFLGGIQDKNGKPYNPHAVFSEPVGDEALVRWLDERTVSFMPEIRTKKGQRAEERHDKWTGRMMLDLIETYPDPVSIENARRMRDLVSEAHAALLAKDLPRLIKAVNDYTAIRYGFQKRWYELAQDPRHPLHQVLEKDPFLKSRNPLEPDLYTGGYARLLELAKKHKIALSPLGKGGFGANWIIHGERSEIQGALREMKLSELTDALADQSMRDRSENAMLIKGWVNPRLDYVGIQISPELLTAHPVLDLKEAVYDQRTGIFKPYVNPALKVWEAVGEELRETRHENPPSNDYSERLYRALERTLRSLAEKIEAGKIQPDIPLITRKGSAELTVKKNNRESRVGVVALAANPLNWGHILIALMSMDQLDLDSVVFLVQGDIDYKRVTQDQLIPKASRHQMSEETLKMFAPLLRYTDIGLDNGERAQKNIHELMRMNTGTRAKFIYISGSETEQRLYEMARLHVQYFDADHPYEWAVAERGEIGKHLTPEMLYLIAQKASEEAGKTFYIRTHVIRDPDIDLAVNSTDYRSTFNPLLVPKAIHQAVTANGFYGYEGIAKKDFAGSSLGKGGQLPTTRGKLSAEPQLLLGDPVKELSAEIKKRIDAIHAAGISLDSQDPRVITVSHLLEQYVRFLTEERPELRGVSFPKEAVPNAFFARAYYQLLRHRYGSLKPQINFADKKRSWSWLDDGHLRYLERALSDENVTRFVLSREQQVLFIEFERKVKVTSEAGVLNSEKAQAGSLGSVPLALRAAGWDKMRVKADREALKSKPATVAFSLGEWGVLGPEVQKEVSVLLIQGAINVILTNVPLGAELPLIFHQESARVRTVAGSLGSNELATLRGFLGEGKIVYLSELLKTAEEILSGLKEAQQQKIMAVKTKQEKGVVTAAILCATNESYYAKSFEKDSFGFWVLSEMGRLLANLLEGELSKQVLAQAA